MIDSVLDAWSFLKWFPLDIVQITKIKWSIAENVYNNTCNKNVM